MDKSIATLREAITKLVPLLTGKGLEVTQRGSSAYVAADPETRKPIRVNIPNISDNADPDFVRAIQGFVDHEVAHVLITDFNVFGAGDLQDPKVRQLMATHNIVEDTMIEREMCKIFPGSSRNISNLRRHFIDKISLPAIEKAQDDSERFRYLIVIVMRALAGHKEMQEMMDDHGFWNEPLVEKFVSDLSDETKKKLPTLTTTEQTLEVAKEMIAILYPPEPPEEEDQPNGDDQQEKSQSQDSSKSQSDGSPEESSDGDGSGDTSDEQESDSSSDEPTEQLASDNKDEDQEPDQDENDTSEDEQSESDLSENDEPGGDDEPGNDASDDMETNDGSSEDQEPSNSSSDEPETDSSDDQSNTNPDASQDDAGESEGEQQSSGSSGDDDDDEQQSSDPSSADNEDGDDDEGYSQGSNGAPPEDTQRDSDKDSADGGSTDEADHQDQNGDGGVGDGGTSGSPFDIDEDALEDMDMSSAISQEISEMAVHSLSLSDYNVYSKDFDRIEKLKVPKKYSPESVKRLEDKTKYMTGRMQKDMERMLAAQSRVLNISGHRSGRLHSAGLYRLAASDHRIFCRREEHKSLDTAVSLLVDNSGSMTSNDRINLAMTSAYALASTLERSKIAFECLGFTTGNHNAIPASIMDSIYDELRKDAQRGVEYNRVTPIHMPIYKGFDERIGSDVKRRFAYAADGKIGMYQNIDGESVEYAALRLTKRTERRKIVFVLSDGHPAGARNVGGHLKAMVEKIEEAGIAIIGIGIQSNSVSQFYKNNVVIDEVENLPGEVMRQLKSLLI